jgi:hypothetical protein
MFNRDDINALITTGLIILLGYASVYVLVYLDEYLKLTN